MDFLSSLGRFHLLVLHLPIGFLLLAGLLELAAKRNEALRPAIGFSLRWGMLSSLLATILGYFLSLDGGYDARLLDLHQWLGFGTAVLAVALYFFYKKMNSGNGLGKFYRPTFLLTLGALLGTGHFGGSLTHGSDFLFEKTKSKTTVPLVNLDSAEVFADLVLPVLEDKCTSCHNPSKKKGGLVMTTQHDLLKGGENGSCIVPDDVSGSLLTKYIHLPKSDDLHMPPDGKKQLTDFEIELLDWWVQSGADFEKKVVEVSLPENLQNELTAQAEANADPLTNLQLEPLSEGKLKNLRAEGFKVQPLAMGSPMLSVSLAGHQGLSANFFKKLKKAAPNIVHLDLRNSNVDDKLLSTIAELPHLNRLYLNGTAVTDAGMEHLADLQFLEYLNLYGTSVTDDGLSALENLPKLRSVYIWQTKVSESGIAKFVSAKPEVQVNRGIKNDSLFGEVKLKPPSFRTETQLFENELEVELAAGFGGANIFYTLDGSEPDTNSAKYDAPIRLTASAKVKSILVKPGWTPSEVSSKIFTKIRYTVENNQSTRPHQNYSGSGPTTLIDLTKGDQNFRSGKWQGWQGEHLVATLDLGKVTDVSRVTVGVLEDINSWIIFPKGLKVSTSLDGRNFSTLGTGSYPVPAEMTEPSTKNISLVFSKKQARYVRVEVLSQLKNPAWHPAAGEPCWLFVDEILVE